MYTHSFNEQNKTFASLNNSVCSFICTISLTYAYMYAHSFNDQTIHLAELVRKRMDESLMLHCILSYDTNTHDHYTLSHSYAYIHHFQTEPIA